MSIIKSIYQFSTNILVCTKYFTTEFSLQNLWIVLKTVQALASLKNYKQLLKEFHKTMGFKQNFLYFLSWLGASFLVPLTARLCRQSPSLGAVCSVWPGGCASRAQGEPCTTHRVPQLAGVIAELWFTLVLWECRLPHLHNERTLHRLWTLFAGNFIK